MNNLFRAEAERRKREAMSSTNKMLSDELTSSERKLKHTEDDLLEFRFVLYYYFYIFILTFL